VSLYSVDPHISYIILSLHMAICSVLTTVLLIHGYLSVKMGADFAPQIRRILFADL
jgi:hypothetical protein